MSGVEGSNELKVMGEHFRHEGGKLYRWSDVAKDFVFCASLRGRSARQAAESVLITEDERDPRAML